MLDYKVTKSRLENFSIGLTTRDDATLFLKGTKSGAEIYVDQGITMRADTLMTYLHVSSGTHMLKVKLKRPTSTADRYDPTGSRYYFSACIRTLYFVHTPGRKAKVRQGDILVREIPKLPRGIGGFLDTDFIVFEAAKDFVYKDDAKLPAQATKGNEFWRKLGQGSSVVHILYSHDTIAKCCGASAVNNGFNKDEVERTFVRVLQALKGFALANNDGRLNIKRDNSTDFTMQWHLSNYHPMSQAKVSLDAVVFFQGSAYQIVRRGALSKSLRIWNDEIEFQGTSLHSGVLSEHPSYYVSAYLRGISNSFRTSKDFLSQLQKFCIQEGFPQSVIDDISFVDYALSSRRISDEIGLPQKPLLIQEGTFIRGIDGAAGVVHRNANKVYIHKFSLRNGYTKIAPFEQLSRCMYTQDLSRSMRSERAPMEICRDSRGDVTHLSSSYGFASDDSNTAGSYRRSGEHVYTIRSVFLTYQKGILPNVDYFKEVLGHVTPNSLHIDGSVNSGNKIFSKVFVESRCRPVNLDAYDVVSTCWSDKPTSVECRFVPAGVYRFGEQSYEITLFEFMGGHPHSKLTHIPKWHSNCQLAEVLSPKSRIEVTPVVQKFDSLMTAGVKSLPE